MTDFLNILANDARKTIAEGYYIIPKTIKRKHQSLKESILHFNRAPIITEIKLASPSLGIIREDVDVEKMASRMKSGGSVAISVITEPKHFMGSLNNLKKVRKMVELPILMKDIFVSFSQIDAASAIGADSILLIKSLFDSGYCECEISEMIKHSHSKGLEVLLETHTKDEFQLALETESDMIGINNRDLKTLKVDINTTRNILKNADSQKKIIVSESGITTPSDIRFLHQFGVQAFLIGSAIMTSEDPEKKIKELVTSI